MAAPSAQTILSVEKKGFDLTSKDYVELRKTGNFTPVGSVEEFSARLQSDAKAILEVINDGLQEYSRKQLASDESVKWQLVEEDEDGKETLSEFAGDLISQEKGKQLNQVVIQLAKTIFGYAKKMVADDAKANKAAKDKAKADALAMLMSNPATIEGLRK